MKKISICISTYEMGGRGPIFLRESFDKMRNQTFKDFDVVVSDQSIDNGIKKICDEYSKFLDIKYIRETEYRGNASMNTNNAIKHADGQLIKILFLDDFLYNEDSLKDIVENFDLEHDRWMLTASEHSKDGKTFYRPFYPRYNDDTILFKNSVSSPSVLTIKNDNPPLFDPKLTWRLDLDYYKRCYQRFGSPKILNKINVVNRVGLHQLTFTAAIESKREKEFVHILEKYNLPNKKKLLWEYRLERYKRQIKKIIKKLIRYKDQI